MEVNENSVNLDFIQFSNSSEDFNGEKKKAAPNFDLNIPADRGFDLNKFPDEGEEAYVEKEFQEVVRLMLKVYLPNFY